MSTMTKSEPPSEDNNNDGASTHGAETLEEMYSAKEYVEAIPLSQFNQQEHLSKCLRAFGEMSEKYFDLVWLARKPHPNADPDYYKEDDESGKKSLKQQARVIGLYPDEVKELAGPEGDWTHGFNSGCLAAFRFVQECLDGFLPDPIHDALQNFPTLDT